MNEADSILGSLIEMSPEDRNFVLTSARGWRLLGVDRIEAVRRGFAALRKWKAEQKLFDEVKAKRKTKATEE